MKSMAAARNIKPKDSVPDRDCPKCDRPMGSYLDRGRRRYKCWSCESQRIKGWYERTGNERRRKRYATDSEYREKRLARENERAHERIKRRKQILYDEATRRGNRCEICEHGPYASNGEFAWHHRHRDKRFNIGQAVHNRSISDDELREELGRCILVCNVPRGDIPSCHIELHRIMRGKAAEAEVAKRRAATGSQHSLSKRAI